MSFANKVVLVTGASSGIGAGAAEHLAKKGASVALVGRNERKLNEVCERIKSAGSPTPFVVVADITVDAVRIINETTNHFGQLDILINNAGIQSHNTIENIDLDEYDRIMRTNVRSVIELTKLAVPQLEKTKGNILNVSSSCGLRVKPNLFAYCISKAAVNQLTKSAALDLAPKGIRVNAINPVVIKTSIFETGFGMSSQQIDEFYAKHSALYPLRRVGEVSDTSAAIEYLVSDHASFITGALLPVDGGALTAGQ
ncbi:uncharacterized oxidoreductase TM_0325-like isoform X1 [Sitodiplosis mosellana]|uniref:uncharacterized oxidoreductase TM_0325-like isoform X1 n=1 Tax=Sitodiplosis mosellana TaxID=263140 RepID=UPI0024443CB7|nr:uncharacterized oxidoreductase TM_0325-like isoform X1 [Sitodiplosis mosellana]